LTINHSGIKSKVKKGEYFYVKYTHRKSAFINLKNTLKFTLK